MALGLNFASAGSSGEIIPIIKFDCRAGRMFRRDRMNGETVQVDITRGFKAVMDFENIETGWIDFDTGGAPAFAVTKLGSTPLAQPTPKHKPGVRLLVKLGKDSGGDMRELASTAKAFLRGIDDLHTAYEAGKAANPGKLPVCELTDTVAITSGEGAKKSTNYAPVFSIVSWVARPADLVWKPKAVFEAAPAQAAEMPPQLTPSASAGASDDDFG
jgi:hypothetical protein